MTHTCEKNGQKCVCLNGPALEHSFSQLYKYQEMVETGPTDSESIRAQPAQTGQFSFPSLNSLDRFKYLAKLAPIAVIDHP